MTNSPEDKSKHQVNDSIYALIGDDAKRVVVGKDINVIEIAGFTIRKWVAWLLLSVLIIFGITMTSFTALNIKLISPTTTTIIPTATAIIPIPSFVAFKKLLIGENENDYKLEITTLNPLDQDLLITHIRILANETDYGVSCCCGEVGDYKISDEISINSIVSNTLEFESKLSQESEKFKGYAFMAQGSATYSCGFSKLQLDFDTSLLMPKKAYFAFVITIPKQFTVIENNSHGGLINEQEEHLDLSPIYFYLPEDLEVQQDSVTITPAAFDDISTFVTEVTLDSQKVISMTLVGKN